MDDIGQGNRHICQLWTVPADFAFSGQLLIADAFRFDTISKVVQFQWDNEGKLTNEPWGSRLLEPAAGLDWTNLTNAPYQ